MDESQKKAIERYQCPGCLIGNDISCFKKYSEGIGCGKHYAGYGVTGIGSIFTGMPKGFCRIGNSQDTKIIIYKSFSDYNGYDKWNIPTWKYLDEYGHTLVRWMSPRTNYTGLHIFLEDCVDKINCYEVTEDDIKYMD